MWEDQSAANTAVTQARDVTLNGMDAGGKIPETCGRIHNVRLLSTEEQFRSAGLPA